MTVEGDVHLLWTKTDSERQVWVSELRKHVSPLASKPAKPSLSLRITQQLKPIVTLSEP